MVENNPEWFKEQPPVEWEILSFEYGDGVVKIQGNHKKACIDFHLNRKDKIYSVKRLSDGEVFTVGDMVEWGSLSAVKNSIAEIKKGAIERFGFNDKKELMAFGNEHKKNCFGLFIPMLSKSKTPPVDTDTFVWHEMYPNPTESDVNSPEFKAIWEAIKGWDLQRQKGVGYGGVSGSDVMHILEALRKGGLWFYNPPKEKQDTFQWTDSDWVGIINNVKQFGNDIGSRKDAAEYLVTQMNIIYNDKQSKSTPKEDKVEVLNFTEIKMDSNYSNSYFYYVSAFKTPIPPEKYEPIKKAIEEVLNQK
jgi:hypothetical protein